MNNLKEENKVRIGLEVGEHISDYENFMSYVCSNYDVAKLDFILITMKPKEMRENLWYEWATFFKENNIHFAFLYTQQRGAPEGKLSHLTPKIVENIKKIAGDFFLGDMIGETGGLASWMEGYYEDYGLEKLRFETMQEAADNYVNHVASRVEIDRNFNVPAVLAVEATIFSRYNFKAGVDIASIEMMCGNPEIMFASARGACKTYGRKWWASHIANEWYGGFRNDDPLKYKRLKLSYYYSYLAGAKYIYPESGDIKIASYGCDYDSEHEFCKAYRSIWNEFADFVHKHGRPASSPKVKIGFIQGNNDSWTGWGGATVWNQFNREEWAYGPAEHGWECIENLYKGDKWHTPTVYGENDQSAGIPYGLYDIVPSEATVEVLQQYSCLIFAGWNTMTGELYENLKSYVYNGGKLFLSVPHLSTYDKRDGKLELLNGGDFGDFLGCNVKGEGRRVNWGVKFVEDSPVPGYKYPHTSNSVCDPICAGGFISCADVELTTGKVVALLSDKFIKCRDGSPAILVENAYGKGYTSLITAWEYPGSQGLEKMFKVILKAIMAGEQDSQEVKVISNEKVHYSVYDADEGNGYVVCLLNTDYNVSAQIKLKYGKHEKVLELESCCAAIVNIGVGGIEVCK